MSARWHLKSTSETFAELKSAPHEGLSSDEVVRRRESFGSNVLEVTKRKSPWKIFADQFGNTMVLVLLTAALIAFFLSEPQDSIAILAIVFLNGIMGFVQEYRAEKTMESLQALVTPRAKVKRHGKVALIPAYELVPGDLVMLESGNFVPADLRIVESADLEVNESTLTGESFPVLKICQALDREVVVADQKNMAFKGTMVSAGRGVGIVVRTGMSTELGKIAKLLREEVEVETPLQKKMGRFAKSVAVLVIGLCAVIFVVGLMRGETPVLMLLTALSLAVAAIPEALPAVVSLTLALGARVMAKQNALVRKLSAVEALGSVTTICSDKTGTLTENRMTVQVIRAVTPEAEPWLFRMLSLSNDATVSDSGALQGDPTETALLAAAIEAGYQKADLEKEFPRVAEIPFSSERGMMTTVHRQGDEYWIFSKGAPEKVISLCTKRFKANGGASFDPAKVIAEADALGRDGNRVLAFAFAPMKTGIQDIDVGGMEETSLS